MITKKEILQKIATKEIKTLDQIEKNFLKDDDVLKLYFDDLPSISIGGIKKH
jgi:hypothetical protein